MLIYKMADLAGEEPRLRESWGGASPAPHLSQNPCFGWSRSSELGCIPGTDLRQGRLLIAAAFLRRFNKTGCRMEADKTLSPGT